MKILAIDLGKFKSTACIFEGISSEHSFTTVRTVAAEMHDLLAMHRPDRVVIEVGPSAGWIKDMAEAMGLTVQVANPNHEAWRWKNVKRKTDQDDALKLAQLSAMNQLPTLQLPANRVRQWRSLIGYSIAYADGADGIVTGLSSDEIEIMPTLAGDADLAGSVSFYDFQVVLSDFGKSDQSWDQGDFDYSGTVDFYDFQVVLSNFGQSDGALTSGEMATLNSFAARFGDGVTTGTDGGLSLVSVPEPASIGVVVAGLALLARRRRTDR